MDLPLGIVSSTSLMVVPVLPARSRPEIAADRPEPLVTTPRSIWFM